MEYRGCSCRDGCLASRLYLLSDAELEKIGMVDSHGFPDKKLAEVWCARFLLLDRKLNNESNRGS